MSQNKTFSKRSDAAFTKNCVGKVTLYSEEKGMAYAKKVKKKYGRETLMRTYKCKFCKLWHLTSKTT